MKAPMHYVNDADGNVQAVQVPNEYKFTYLLERNLKPPVPFKKTEVWNFGYPGDNTGTAFSRWLHQAKALPFNLIIFTVNDNDLLENRPNEPDAPNNAFLIEDPKNNSFTVDYPQINQTPNK